MPHPDDLTRHALRGLRWVYLGTAVGAGVQLTYTAVMSRLLPPQAFGLVAMAFVLERFGSHFSRMGVSQSLIQKPDLDDDDIRVAVTMSFVLAAVFGTLIFFLAPLANHYYGSTHLASVLRLLALAFVVANFAEVSTALLRRRMKFDTLAKIEVAAQTTALLAIGIPLAYRGFGLWSLVAARLSQTSIHAVLAYCATRHPMKPLTQWNRVRLLYGYGSRVSVISFFEFVGTSLDMLLIGRFAGSTHLGYYSRAAMLVNLPFYYTVQGLSRVLFPVFSRIQKDERRLESAYKSAYMTVAGILLPTAAGLAVAAPEAVEAVLGEGWEDTARVLPLLAGAVTMSYLSQLGGVVCDATALLRPKIVLQLTHVTILTALLLAAASQESLVWFAGAVLVAEIIRHLMYGMLMSHALGMGVRSHFNMLFPGLVTATMTASGIALVTVVLGPWLHVALLFAAQLLIGALIFGLALVLGPLRPIKIELHNRLLAAGMLSGDGTLSRFASRVLTYQRG